MTPIYESTLRDRTLVDIRAECTINVEKIRSAETGIRYAQEIERRIYKIDYDDIVFGSKEEEEKYKAWKKEENGEKSGTFYQSCDIEIDFLRSSEQYWRILFNMRKEELPS